MNDLDQQNTSFEDDERVQIIDLDPAGTSQKRLVRKLLATLHKGVATPWIRYGSIGLLLLILLGVLFLQTYRTPLTTSTAAISNETGASPPANGSNVSFGSDQLYIQASDGTLTAYQAENGRVLWHDKLPEHISLQTSDQVVYVYYATADNGMLKALNGNNGHVLWQATLPAPGTEWALEQFGDTLYAADHSNTIHAFQASNGHLRWTYHDSISPVLPVGNLLQVQDGIAEITLSNNTADLLNASDGREIVRVQPDGGNAPQVIVDGSLIYVLPNVGGPTQEPIQIFRISDGKRLWSWTSPLTGTAGSITEQDGVIYLSSLSSDDTSSLTALRASDGHILWTYHTSDHSAIVPSPIEEPGVIYIFLQDNTAICLRASNGQPIWSTQITIAKQFIYPPDFFLESGIIFLYYSNNPSGGTTSEDNQVYVLRASDGKILWHPPGFSGQPWVQTGILYTSQTNGRIDAWRESDGAHLWRFQALPEMYAYGDQTSNTNLVILTDQQGDVEVLRTSDGKLLWRYRAR